MVLPVHQRMAELWTTNKRRELTGDEIVEFDQCLRINASYVWEMAYLSNMSLLASMIGDVDWLHEVCIEIDQLEQKKPDRSNE
jgi:hypothetical protein